MAVDQPPLGKIRLESFRSILISGPCGGEGERRLSFDRDS